MPKEVQLGKPGLLPLASSKSVKSIMVMVMVPGKNITLTRYEYDHETTVLMLAFTSLGFPTINEQDKTQFEQEYTIGSNFKGRVSSKDLNTSLDQLISTHTAQFPNDSEQNSPLSLKRWFFIVATSLFKDPQNSKLSVKSFQILPHEQVAPYIVEAYLVSSMMITVAELLPRFIFDPSWLDLRNRHIETCSSIVSFLKSPHFIDDAEKVILEAKEAMVEVGGNSNDTTSSSNSNQLSVFDLVGGTTIIETIKEVIRDKQKYLRLEQDTESWALQDYPRLSEQLSTSRDLVFKFYPVLFSTPNINQVPSTVSSSSSNSNTSASTNSSSQGSNTSPTSSSSVVNFIPTPNQQERVITDELRSKINELLNAWSYTMINLHCLKLFSSCNAAYADRKRLPSIEANIQNVKRTFALLAIYRRCVMAKEGKEVYSNSLTQLANFSRQNDEFLKYASTNLPTQLKSQYLYLLHNVLSSSPSSGSASSISHPASRPFASTANNLTATVSSLHTRSSSTSSIHGSTNTSTAGDGRSILASLDEITNLKRSILIAESLRQENSQLKLELEHRDKNTTLQQSVQAQQVELNELKIQLDAKQKRVTQLENELRKLEISSAGESETRYQEMEQLRRSKIEAVQEVNSQLEAAKSEISRLKSAHASELAQISQQLQSVLRDKERVMALNDTLRANLDKNNQSIIATSAQLSSLQTMSQKIQTELQLEISRLQSDISQSQAEETKKLLVIQALNDEIASLKACFSEDDSEKRNREEQSKKDEELARSLHEEESPGINPFKTELLTKTHDSLVDLVIEYKIQAEQMQVKHQAEMDKQAKIIKNLNTEILSVSDTVAQHIQEKTDLSTRIEDLTAKLEEQMRINDSWAVQFARNSRAQ